MKYTAHEANAVRFTILPGSVTATISGSVVSSLGTHGECLAVATYGVCSGTGSSTIKIQTSTDGTVWTDITSATFGAKVLADDEAQYTMRLDLKEVAFQRVRGFETIAGSFKSVRGVDLFMRPNHVRPATQTKTVVVV